MNLPNKVARETIFVARECALLFKRIDAKLYRHQIEKLEKLERILKDGTETIN